MREGSTIGRNLEVIKGGMLTRVDLLPLHGEPVPPGPELPIPPEPDPPGPDLPEPWPEPLPEPAPDPDDPVTGLRSADV